MKQYLLVIPLFLFFSCKKSEKSPVDFVNPHIGTISHLLTTPSAEAYLPHSMMHIAPITVNGFNDRYLAQRIYGFPVGNASFMPVSGKYASTPDSCSSSFDRDFEIVTPYFISEQLDDYNAKVEATLQSQSAWFRVKWSNKKDNFLVLFLPGDAEIILADSFNLNGCNSYQGTKKYFHLNFSAMFSVERIYSDSASSGNRIFGKDKTLVIKFKQPEISIKTGISFIDITQAQQNLKREMADKQFEEVVQSAKNTWNEVLGKIEITSLTNDQKVIFYTAMYRALNSMWNITEDGRYFSIFDKKVHSSGGRDFYTGDGLWDSYRVKHPLQLILNPGQQEDMLESYARMYKQYGTMPVFPFPQGELTYMLGNHLAIFAADTWKKGNRNFDLSTVYEGLINNSLERTMLPDVNAPKTTLDLFYQQNGYFPALKESDIETEPVASPMYRRQAVAITLENSTDDYCISELAAELKKDSDQQLFQKRASNFKNVFNTTSRFMSPKMADGTWVPNFNPVLSGRQAGRDYFAECNSWVYSFHVQHDVEGLMQLFGSRKAFTQKLDSLFSLQYPGYKFDFQKQFPDMTGLTGMHSQGNEPAFHIPYLYCYAGEPWKTQKIVRQIMDAWYLNHPLGLCGDDDDGTLSAWYVFSAMGFYPVSPGMPYYVIGSPIFPKTRIKLSNGKVFTIEAQNVSRQNKYIQSAHFHGKTWDKPWFTHEDMMRGGTLELVMGPRPNQLWGAKPENAPPSMSGLITNAN